MNRKTITISEIIYFLYFAVMFGARAAGLYEGMILYNISLVVGMLLFLFKIASTEHSVAEYIIMVFLLGVSLLVYHNTGEKGFLLYMTMMLGMKGVSLKRLEKWALIIMAVCFNVTVLLAVTGIKKDISYPADGRAFFGSIMRRCLGYPFFNTMFTTYIIFIVLIMLVVEFKSKKEIIITSLFLYAFAIYFYIYTCSNTGLIVTTLYLFLNYILWNTKDKRVGKGMGIIIQLIYPAFLIFSILGPVLIIGDAFNLLDKVFHNRFKYANYFLTTEPITLFGIRFAPAWSTNAQIDSSFLYSFLQLGIIPCVILTIMMMLMIHSLVKNNRKKDLAVVISFMVLGMSDPFFFNLSYKNLLFLYIGELFWLEFDKTGVCNAFLNKRIIVLSIGKKELNIAKFLIEREKKLGAFFNSMVGIKGKTNFIIFATLTIVLFLIGCMLSDTSIISGAVDMPDEWELVRSLLSIAIWSALFVTMIMNYITSRKEKKRNEV